VQLAKVLGKLMLTALKLFGPLITAPLFAVHRYEEAWNTGVIE
jgi:hypothetical protein